MKRVLMLLGVGALTIGQSGSALAFTVGQKKFIKQYDKYLQQEVATFERICGYKLDASIDWKSFQQEIQEHLDAASGNAKALRKFTYCNDPVKQLYLLCRQDKDYKAAVRAKVKKYVCRYGGDASTAKSAYKKRRLTLSGGVLTMFFSWLAGDHTFPKFLRNFLHNQL